MDKEKFDKLPVWAQQYIQKLARERDTAISTLNKLLDAQTRSSVYYDKIVCTGESQTGGPSTKRHYVQSDDITIAAYDVELHVRLDEKHRRLKLSWNDPGHMSTEIAMIPTQQQQVELVHVDNL